MKDEAVARVEFGNGLAKRLGDCSQNASRSDVWRRRHSTEPPKQVRRRSGEEAHVISSVRSALTGLLIGTALVGFPISRQGAA